MDEAVAEYRQAIAIRPAYWQNHNRLGRAFAKAGRFREAAAAYRRVTELQPDSTVGFNNLGVVASMQGDLALGLESYTRSAEIAPSASTFSNIGTIHYWNGNFDSARQAYEKAIALKSDAGMHRNLGDALQGLHDTAGARMEYLRALDLVKDQLKVNPKDAASLSLAALVEVKLGRQADARTHIDAALILAPTDGEVLYRNAAIAALSGDKTRAFAALKDAIGRGYSVVVAAHDLDLQAVRGLPEFAALVQPKNQ